MLQLIFSILIGLLLILIAFLAFSYLSAYYHLTTHTSYGAIGTSALFSRTHFLTLRSNSLLTITYPGQLSCVHLTCLSCNNILLVHMKIFNIFITPSDTQPIFNKPLTDLK